MTSTKSGSVGVIDIGSRLELGLVEFGGSKKNNTLFPAEGGNSFVPLKDANPDHEPGEQYKALGRLGESAQGLYAYVSGDGIRPEGPQLGIDENGPARDVMTCTSADFRAWTEPQWLQYPGAPLPPVRLADGRVRVRAGAPCWWRDRHQAARLPGRTIGHELRHLRCRQCPGRDSGRRWPPAAGVRAG